MNEKMLNGLIVFVVGVIIGALLYTMTQYHNDNIQALREVKTLETRVENLKKELENKETSEAQEDVVIQENSTHTSVESKEKVNYTTLEKERITIPINKSEDKPRMVRVDVQSYAEPPVSNPSEDILVVTGQGGGDGSPTIYQEPTEPMDYPDWIPSWND